MTTTTTLDISVVDDWIPWCSTAPIPYIICWVILFGAAVFNTIFGGYAVNKTCKTQTNKDIVYTLYIIINILFILSAPILCFQITQSVFCWWQFYEWMVIGLIPVWFYMEGLALLYLWYLIRLRKIFEKTQFFVSLWLSILCFIGYGIQLFTPMIMFYYFMLNDWVTALRVYNVFLGANFLFNVILLCLFIVKIRTLGRMMVSQIIGDDNNQRDKTKIKLKTKLNTNIRRLLTPSIRMIICASIAMISSNLISIEAIYRGEFNDGQMLWISHLMLMCCDASLNIYFLYLQYKSDNLYIKCCNKCHIFVYNIFVKTFADEYGSEQQQILKIIKQTEHTLSTISLSTSPKDVNNADNIVVNNKAITMISMDFEKENLIKIENIETENLKVNVPIAKDISTKSLKKSTTNTSSSGMDISTRLYV
eukprot:15220_1